MRPDRLQKATSSIAKRVVVRMGLLLLVSAMMSSTFPPPHLAT
jgi:hypothetical protein